MLMYLTVLLSKINKKITVLQFFNFYKDCLLKFILNNHESSSTLAPTNINRRLKIHVRSFTLLYS